MRFIKLILVLILSIFSVKSVSAINIPQYSGRVNDFAQVFSPIFTSSLEQKILQVESQTTDQIAIVTVNNLQGTTIEDFAEQLFKAWGIGQKGKDNGILLLISVEDRKVRMEVGYGLEPIITDGRAGEIIRNQITPELKKGDYEAGVLAGVDKISQYLTGTIPLDQEKSNISSVVPYFPFIIFFIINIFVYIFAFLARSKSFYAGGITGLIIGYFIGIFISTPTALILAILIGLFGLILDFILSKNYQRLKKLNKSTKFWDSSGGFGGGGFHTGGGFSGGSSGGGGSSGSW